MNTLNLASQQEQKQRIESDCIAAESAVNRETMNNQQLINLIKDRPIPLCTCNGYICEDGDEVYQCLGCQRLVPWCYGGGDKYKNYCDDCHHELIKNEP